MKKADTTTRQLSGRITITGPADLVADPTIDELKEHLARMRKGQNVNANIVKGEIVRREHGDAAYDVPTRVHLAHMEYGSIGEPFKDFAERRGCRLRYDWSVERPARKSLAKEFFMLDEANRTGEEFAIMLHPAYPALDAIAFAKVLLVMFGTARAQGKLAAMFRDEAELDQKERMFFFAVGAALDYAIDHADDAVLTTEPAQAAINRAHADAEPEEIASVDDAEREANELDARADAEESEAKGEMFAEGLTERAE